MRSLLTGLLVLLPTLPAWAACRPDQKLAIVGSMATGSEVIASAAKEVRLIAVTCGASACVAGVYDAATLSNATVANARFEASAPANQTTFLDQHLTFSTGVTVVDDGNVTAVSAFECVAR